MGILRSFNIGVSGLSAVGQGMGVIADNIANSGTNGFKASRSEFQDVLATSLKGIDGGDQFGAGVKLSHIKPMMSQGDVSRTDSITDLAINGNGFFKLKTHGGFAYSRDGSMHFNKEGVLVNSDGYMVQGFVADEDGKITNRQANIKLGNTTIPAKASSKIDLNMNLDSRVDIKQFDATKPDKTSNYNHTVTVYDNIGSAHLMTIYYNKTSNNNWAYHAMVDGKDAEGGKSGVAQEMANGNLIFNDKGVLAEEVEGNNSFNFNKGASPGQKIAFNFGISLKEDGDGLSASTQYGSNSAISKHTIDGYSAATLSSLSFNDDGILTAVYDNGISKNMAQIGIGKFENNEGLFKIGKNLFKESIVSGAATIGKPGEAGRGGLLSKSLELSNVDIASEFVNLMTSQRNFSANAKTLTTADQMLQDVLNIKR